MSILTEFMGGIADAIRADGKTAGPIPAAEFAEQIQEKVLASFGADATPETILEGSTAYVKGELIEGTLKQAKSRVEFFDLNSDGFPRKIIYIFDGNAPANFFNTNSVTQACYIKPEVCESVEIHAKELLSSAFASVFRSFVGKLKLINVTKLQGEVFKYIGDIPNAPTGSKFAVWLPKTISVIEKSSNYGDSDRPFNFANENYKVYCEAPEKPNGWTSNWNSRNDPYYKDYLTVFWGVTESEFDNL